MQSWAYSPLGFTRISEAFVSKAEGGEDEGLASQACSREKTRFRRVVDIRGTCALGRAFATMDIDHNRVNGSSGERCLHRRGVWIFATSSESISESDHMPLCGDAFRGRNFLQTTQAPSSLLPPWRPPRSASTVASKRVRSTAHVHGAHRACTRREAWPTPAPPPNRPTPAAPSASATPTTRRPPGAKMQRRHAPRASLRGAVRPTSGSGAGCVDAPTSSAAVATGRRHATQPRSGFGTFMRNRPAAPPSRRPTASRPHAVSCPA